MANMRFHVDPQPRCSTAAFSVRRPPKPASAERGRQTAYCPWCEQRLPGSIRAMFAAGVRQLVCALYVLGAAVVRGLRFLVAGVLCLLSLLGACCAALGRRIAHPADRKMLEWR